LETHRPELTMPLALQTTRSMELGIMSEQEEPSGLLEPSFRSQSMVQLKPLVLEQC
jgi:hypothetical protein